MPQTTFLEEEDKMLVQQARRYTDRGERIAWGQVQNKMRRWGRTSKELSQRLNSLKKTSIVVRTIRMPNLLHPNQALNLPATTQQDASGEIQRQAHAPRPAITAWMRRKLWQAVETIFDRVTRSTVVYPAASPSLNAGELLPSGKPTFVQVLESRFERNLSRLARKR
ncbi:hypothetical protein PF001_g5324 [Phytophthora fragariae]|uniref:Myb-like domain-containing protein n=1 Tax=Phytophthora fragariae TaxID=53985 RepID=A0A6A4ECQ6_9STRA|nr:hypothetical protein PF001_g5324 [Phytophthora fragariae]